MKNSYQRGIYQGRIIVPYYTPEHLEEIILEGFKQIKVLKVHLNGEYVNIIGYFFLEEITKKNILRLKKERVKNSSKNTIYTLEDLEEKTIFYYFGILNGILEERKESYPYTRRIITFNYTLIPEREKRLLEQRLYLMTNAKKVLEIEHKEEEDYII